MSPWQMSEAELLAEILRRCEGRDIWPVRVAPERIQQRIAENRGFPDLVIYGPGGVIHCELKTCKGRERVRPAQTVWKYRVQSSGGNHDFWTPADLSSGHIDDCLRWLETPRPGNPERDFAFSMARHGK